MQKYILGLCFNARHRSFYLRRFSIKSNPPSSPNTPLEESEENEIDISLTLEKWDKRLKSAEVGNRDYNLKHILAHALRIEPVNINII